MLPTTLDLELQSDLLTSNRRAGRLWQRNDVLFFRYFEYIVNFVTASLVFAAVYRFLSRGAP